jgi:hypothetical protein
MAGVIRSVRSVPLGGDASKLHHAHLKRNILPVFMRVSVARTSPTRSLHVRTSAAQPESNAFSITSALLIMIWGDF